MASLCKVQLVTRWRAAFIPVIKLTLVGEQTGVAYAWVNFIPSLASRSILGVRYVSLKGVFLSQKGTEVSCHPISSTKNKMMFGLGFSTTDSCCFLEAQLIKKTETRQQTIRFFINLNNSLEPYHLKFLLPPSSF